MHARIQGSWCNYSKCDGNSRHVWLRNLRNDDGSEGVNLMRRLSDTDENGGSILLPWLLRYE